MSVVKQKKSEPVKTLLVIVVGMLVIHLLTQHKWALWVSVAVGLSGLISPFLAKQIDFLWNKLGELLSMIVPNILLSLIFFIFLTPIALLSRLFGKKNPLDLKNSEASLFKDHNKPFDKASFEKPW